MQYLHKKTNSVYFDEPDLKQLFEASSRLDLTQKIKECGIGPQDLFADPNKVKEILNSIKILKDKEDMEIFTALYMLLNFYPGTKIGFPLKDSINIESSPINSIQELKELTKENDLTDVYLLGSDGARAFQLKQYKGSDNSEELFGFISGKLMHYGLDLGDVNFLVTLQCGGDIGNLKLEELHEKLKTLGLKAGGHILLSYNEENKNDVIVTLYPTIGTTRIPHEHISLKQ